MTSLGSEMRIASLPEPFETAERATVNSVTTAELAECTCPEFCERDHDVD